ncbi:MAG: TIGR02710 family CRISPR-associated protein [Ignavibacteriaceae bacterium]|nr:TIGR02710 family CRISPR-associated protein [Ignavibacteriaceae bacterium]
MKKVLIMTIGTGATGADIAHGLLFSIKDSNPNLLVLIGSTKSFETTLGHLKNMIVGESLNTEIIENKIEEVNDLETLHFEYSKIINELVREGYSINKIAVDYTSGTKAMSAALVSAAIENKVGTISYVYGERGEGGRVKTGTERRNSFSPNKFISKDIFQKALELFNSFRYSNCIELLTDHEFHPYYQKQAELLLNLSKMFDAWDKFNFTNAFEISKTINLKELKEFNIKGKFETDYLPLLAKLKEKNLSVKKVFDLIENAIRRASEYKYDDAVARLYRALEMIGQIEFEKEFKCSTSEVNIDKLPEHLREDLLEKYKDKKDGKVKIPLFCVFEILNEVQNELGILFKSKIEEIKMILSLRNNSILAHGLIPLSEKDFNKALEITLNLTSIFSKDYEVSFPKIK